MRLAHHFWPSAIELWEQLDNQRENASRLCFGNFGLTHIFGGDAPCADDASLKELDISSTIHLALD